MKYIIEEIARNMEKENSQEINNLIKNLQSNNISIKDIPTQALGNHYLLKYLIDNHNLKLFLSFKPNESLVIKSTDYLEYLEEKNINKNSHGDFYIKITTTLPDNDLFIIESKVKFTFIANLLLVCGEQNLSSTPIDCPMFEFLKEQIKDYKINKEKNTLMKKSLANGSFSNISFNYAQL
jgi:hypothetical protein